MSKRALITGVSGQDGSYLAEYLLGLEYEVYGLVRPRACATNHNLAECRKHTGFCELEGDLLDQPSLDAAVQGARPHEVYNLAGHTFVGSSWDSPEHVFQVNALGTLRMLQAVQRHAPSARFYQASTSEMFGNQPAPQSEATPFVPCSPYGIAKLAAHWFTVEFRSRGLWACCGIAFNHESARRGGQFVTGKLASHAAFKQATNSSQKLQVGNLHARRDWGHARDYVRAMHAMMQANAPTDYVIGTGRSLSVLEFAELVGLGTDDLEVTSKHMRPTDIAELRADASKIKAAVGWSPSVAVEQLAAEMLRHHADCWKR